MRQRVSECVYVRQRVSGREREEREREGERERREREREGEREREREMHRVEKVILGSSNIWLECLYGGSE